MDKRCLNNYYGYCISDSCDKTIVNYDDKREQKFIENTALKQKDRSNEISGLFKKLDLKTNLRMSEFYGFPCNIEQRSRRSTLTLEKRSKVPAHRY